MLIRHFMTRQVVTLPAEMSCLEAWGKFQDHGLRRTPVERDSQVIGMITDRDLMRILPWTVGDLEEEGARARQEMPLSRVCKRKLIAVTSTDHLETAARLMLEHKIGGLPVLDSKRLVGIITESDLFKIFLRLKLDTTAVRLSLHWPREPETMLDPSPLAMTCGVEIREFMRHPGPTEGTLVDLRVIGEGIDPFLARLLGAGFLLLDREEPGETVRP